MGAAGPSRARLISQAVVVVAACLPYLSTVHDYFVQDDFGVVMLLSRKAWTTFPQWFTMPWMEDIWGYVPDEIRPFPALSYQITAAWGAASPEAHHIFNIAMHAANALLVLAIARSVAGVGPIAAVFSAVTFAVLPAQAESVAWITGRVDSMPAFFYLATFLAYAQWRAVGQQAGRGLPPSPEASADRHSVGGGGRTPAPQPKTLADTSPPHSGVGGGHQTPVPAHTNRLYLWSLVLFVFALFSKQTTITMVATLAAYDLLVGKRPIRPSWAWLRPYVPFVAMTAGFLALRYMFVGTVVREQSLSAQGLGYFVELVGRHLHRVVLGEPAAPAWYMWGAAFAALVAIAVLAIARDDGGGRQHRARVALFFGPVWWVIGVAPVAVAGYESPRHVYLASIAWAVLLGLGLDLLLRRSARRAWRMAVAAAATTLLASYGVQLYGVVRGWNNASAVSKRAVVRLQREAVATAPGSLVIIGAPIRSWEWAAPFMAQPPYTRTDLTARVSIITPRRLHCCPAQWRDRTRFALTTWMAHADHPPIVALYVSPHTGAIHRLSDAEYPALRDLVPMLADVDTAEALDKAIQNLLERLVQRNP